VPATDHAATAENLSEIRLRMVSDQIVRRGITDRRVLEVMSVVPRHMFADSDDYESAYGDHPIQIGYGQTVSQPYMVALMSQCLELSGTERVLEIGTGSGYQAAVLVELAGEVHSVERHEGLANRTRALFERLHLPIEAHVGDGSGGWPDGAPYDRIIVTAGAPRVPAPLIEQLADNGRLVAPVGSRDEQRLLMVVNRGGEIHTSGHGACVFVPLIGESGWDS